MARFEVKTYQWDGTHFYEVRTDDYKKGSWSWKRRSMSVQIREKDTKKELVVESVSDNAKCESSPLKDLITGCEGAVSARAMRADEKL